MDMVKGRRREDEAPRGIRRSRRRSFSMHRTEPGHAGDVKVSACVEVTR
jgi:hypothetical protein